MESKHESQDDRPKQQGEDRMLTSTNLEPLMSTEDVSRYYNVPVATLYRWRYLGTGPRSFVVGRHRRYRRADVLAWLEQRAEPDEAAGGG
jgi:excisionase family DNA binding protein